MNVKVSFNGKEVSEDRIEKEVHKLFYDRKVAQVRDALGGIIDPETGKPVVVEFYGSLENLRMRFSGSPSCHEEILKRLRAADLVQ